MEQTVIKLVCDLCKSNARRAAVVSATVTLGSKTRTLDLCGTHQNWLEAKLGARLTQPDELVAAKVDGGTLSGKQVEVLGSLVAVAGQSPRELETHLQFPVRNHLVRLKQLDLVSATGSTQNRRYTPTAKGRALIERLSTEAA